MDRNDTYILRFIAICLVLNSHLDSYYPIDHIGTGGSIGNALFFMLSSFGLFLSEKNKPQSFRVYSAKRIQRIYSTLWIALLLVIIPIQLRYYNVDAQRVLTLLSTFIFPRYWFLQALMLFYFIGFFLIKNYTHIKIVSAMAAVLALYLFIYLTYLDLSTFSVETMPFKLLFYIQVFFLGILLSSMNEKIKFAGAKDIIVFMISFLVIYGNKYLITKQIGVNLQIIQHVAPLVLVVYALKISRSSFIRERFMQLPYVGRTIQYVGQITLEIYIVHVNISPIILSKKMAFPANALVFLCITFLLAALVNWVAKKAINYFTVKHHAILSGG